MKKFAEDIAQGDVIELGCFQITAHSVAVLPGNVFVEYGGYLPAEFDPDEEVEVVSTSQPWTVQG